VALSLTGRMLDDQRIVLYPQPGALLDVHGSGQHEHRTAVRLV